MQMQEGRIWGKIKYSVDFETSGKNTQLNIMFKLN